jgi:hypothetical protein
MSGDDGRREEDLVFTVLPRIILACIRVHAYALHTLGIPTKEFSPKDSTPQSHSYDLWLSI